MQALHRHVIAIVLSALFITQSACVQNPGNEDLHKLLIVIFTIMTGDYSPATCEIMLLCSL